MSKLSRRTFLKTAGAAALAVAAAGALSACSGNGETWMDLKVNYTTEDGKSGSFMSQTYVGTKVVNTMTIPLPAELSSYIAVRENVPVQKGKDGLSYVEITLKLNIVNYTVKYVCEGETVLTGSLSAAAGTTSFTKKDLHEEEKAALEAKYYTVADDAKITVSGTEITVAVEKVMGTVKVDYYYKSSFGTERCLDYPETVQVWKGTNVIKKSQLTKLEKACGDMGYDSGSVADEIEFNWADAANVVKIYVKTNYGI